MATRVASAVLVHLSAILREEGIYFAIACELAAIGLRNALLDVLDLPGLGFHIVPQRSHGNCALGPAGGLGELFELAGQVRRKTGGHSLVGAWFQDIYRGK